MFKSLLDSNKKTGVIMTIAIFDFNRTLYDPNTDKLLPDVVYVLNTLRKRGVSLHLLSRDNQDRLDLLERHGIHNLFDAINFVEDKSPEAFAKIIRDAGVTAKDTYAIGDYLHKDVRFANQCGAHTIWLQRGNFAGQKPEIPDDLPEHTITEIIEVLNLIPC